MQLCEMTLTVSEMYECEGLSLRLSWATFRFVYLVLAFYPHFTVSFLFCFSFFFLNVTSLLTALAGMWFNSASPPSLLPLSTHCLARIAEES